MAPFTSQWTVNAQTCGTDRLQRISLFTEQLVRAGFCAAGAASVGALTGGAGICLPHVPDAVTLIITGLAVAHVDAGVLVQDLRGHGVATLLLTLKE